VPKLSKLMENLCIYYLQGVQTKATILFKFNNHGNIRKFYISDISRHSVYITITSLSMKYMSRKIDFPYVSNLDFLSIIFNCSYIT